MEKHFHKIYKDAQWLRILVKYGVVAIMALLVSHCGMLCLGIDSLAIHLTLCFFAFVLAHVLNRMFGLCFVHRCVSYYVCTCVLCIVIQRHGLWGEWLHIARLSMFVVGVVLLFAVVWKAVKMNC